MVSVKKIFCFIALGLLFNEAAFCQEGLLVKNNVTGKSWLYKKKSKVTYLRFQDTEYSKGVLRAVLDSSVIFGKDTVALLEIAGIQKKNPIHHITRIAGMPLMLIGSLLMGQGAANFYSDPGSDRAIQGFLLGAGIFAVGYIPYELNLADLSVGIGGEWKLEIVRDTR